jgi:signal transduction histidine kinase
MPGLNVKKLTLSLIIAIFAAIIFLGWGIDIFFDEYQERQDLDEFSEYKQTITSLANTLDKVDNIEQFVETWQSVNQQTLALTALNEFPLPSSLLEGFKKGELLVLESQDYVTLNQIMPSKQQVLTLSVDIIAVKEDNLSLQVVLTTVFYAGILACVFIWLYPLINRLSLLRQSAKKFGEGDFSKRIQIPTTSYIADIEHEFNRMAQKIETLVQDNKLLSNAVSHDLRTPLARLRFGIEALSETNKPENRDKYIQHLSQDIEEMENLVTVLLNYSRLEQKMIKVERLSVDINMLIEASVQNFTMGDTHRIIIDIESTPEHKSMVKGDSNLLTMLINNLLNNAQQYAMSHAIIITKQEGNKVVLSILDDGPGIPQ